MQTREQYQHHQYERFEANRRFEEMTDIAERLGYPIDTTIHYEMRNGAAYALSDTVERPFHNQTFQALERGKRIFVGDQAFEVERLRLEHEEALQLDAFGAGKLPGNVLIKLSKVPDAVVDRTTSIKGYRRDLLRSFVRIYYRTEEGLSCRLFTLDQNHTEGMTAVGRLLGIDPNRPSEEVLSDHTLVMVLGDTEEFVDSLVAASIKTYDDSILATHAEITQAGSKYRDRYNAMEVIAQRSNLLSEHLDAISTIMAQYRSDEKLETVLENQRERTAAAIKLASEGHAISSSYDASVEHEVSQGNYGRECATSLGLNQAQTLSQENIWTSGECQVCFAQTMVGSCRVCARCAAADDQGVDLLKLRDHHAAQRRRRQIAARSIELAPIIPPKKPHPSEVSRRYGEKVTIIKRKTIGGEDRFVINSRGEILDKL